MINTINKTNKLRYVVCAMLAVLMISVCLFTGIQSTFAQSINDPITGDISFDAVYGVDVTANVNYRPMSATDAERPIDNVIYFNTKFSGFVDQLGISVVRSDGSATASNFWLGCYYNTDFVLLDTTNKLTTYDKYFKKGDVWLATSFSTLGWSGAHINSGFISPVKKNASNVILESLFYIKKVITYKTFDGSVLKNCAIDADVAPTAPVREHYSFASWATTTAANGDVIKTATYTKTHYQATYKDYNNTVLKTDWVLNGQTLAAPVATRYGYTFVRWDEATDVPTGNKTYTAVYTINIYNVTFRYIDTDGTEKSIVVKVEHGSIATPPTIPDRPGLVFIGWAEPADKPVVPAV
ncbi:MAG: InlB B-repeat-containing protein [Clostridia bacterium]